MSQILPKYRYSEPTVTVGKYTFDAAALNAFIERAESLFDTDKVRYWLHSQAYGDPSKEISDYEDLGLDCSGFAWYSTFRKRLGSIWDSNPNEGWQKNWVEVNQPIPGAVIRYGAGAGKTHGHVGVIIGIQDGKLQTLDSTSSGIQTKGSIRYRPNAQKFWYSAGDGNTRVLVSRQALLEVDGKPVSRSLNVWLAAAKRPILSTLTLLGLAAGAWAIYRKRRGLPILPRRGA